MLTTLLSLFRGAPGARKLSAKPIDRRFRPFLEMLEERTNPAIYNWTGAAGDLPGGNFNWSTVGNWQVAGAAAVVAPGQKDDLRFNNPGQTNVTSIVDKVFEINSLTSTWASTIQLDNNLTVNNGLTFTAGTFRGGKELVLKGNSTWENGNMFGSGVTRVLGQLRIDTGNNATQHVSLSRILVIEEKAAVVWTKGDIRTSNNAIISNLGTFQAIGTTKGKIEHVEGSVGQFYNVEKGIVKIWREVQINIPFNQQSRRAVQIDSSARQPGRLTLTGGGTSSGVYEHLGQGTLAFDGGTYIWENGTAFSGGGQTIFGDHDHRTVAKISENTTVTSENSFKLVGFLVGQNRQSSQFTNNGYFLWSGGELETLTFTNSANRNIEIDNRSVVRAVAIDTTFNNLGRLDKTGTGTLKLDRQSIFNNDGTFVISTDVNIEGDNRSVFNNRDTGVFRKEGSTGKSEIKVQFVNTGRVIIKAGTLIRLCHFYFRW